MRLKGVTRGMLLRQHRDDLVVQPSTHGFVTIGRILVKNKESGLPLAQLISNWRSSSSVCYYDLMNILVIFSFARISNSVHRYDLLQTKIPISVCRWSRHDISVKKGIKMHAYFLKGMKNKMFTYRLPYHALVPLQRGKHLKRKRH